MQTKATKILPEPGKTKGVGAVLPLELWSRFKVHCTMNNVTQAELIQTLIEEHLEKGGANVNSNAKKSK